MLGGALPGEFKRSCLMAKTSFVRTNDGRYLVQIEDAELFPRWGFALCDDELSWEGGFGACRSWELVEPEEVPLAVRQELQYVIDDYE
jgi:hypothetical protein